MEGVGLWTLDDSRLLKHNKRLVIIKEANLHTCLIAEAYLQLSTAYLGKNKTYKLIGNHYY